MPFPVHIVAAAGFVENKHGEVLLVKDRRSGNGAYQSIVRFVCESVGGELTTSEETSECRWVRKDEALEMISAPAIRTRYQAYLDFEGSIHYAEYITKPEFELKVNRKFSRMRL